MAALETHYKLSISLMTILGLWPYVNVLLRRIQSTIVNFSCILLVIVQIIPLTNENITRLEVLQILSFLIMVLGSVVKFNAFLSEINTIKIIMDSVKSRWNTTHQDTLDILERRAIIGKQQGAIYAIFIYPSALFAVIFRISSYILVVTAPVNSNVTDPFPVITNYLIDREKHFFLITIHQCFAFFFIATIYVATETLFIVWIQHIISLYELARYHMEKGIAEEPFGVSQKLMDAYRKKCLANSVTYYNDAKIFTANMKDNFSFSYAVLLVFAIISLAINFFRLSNAICVSHDMEEMLLSFAFSVSELVYMFYLNYVVQLLLDYADGFPTIVKKMFGMMMLPTYVKMKVIGAEFPFLYRPIPDLDLDNIFQAHQNRYSTPWYKMSLSIQKNILIILIRSSEPLTIDFYGFYNASIEGFSALVKTTVSYFMMVTSLQ